MKKKWLIVGLATGLLAVVITGGVVLAGGGGGHGWGFGKHDGRLSALTERAAEILGIEAQDITDAYAQAREEAAEAQLQDFAGRVAGTLETDAQATAGAIEQVAGEMRSEILETRLQSAIGSGKITEEQAQTYREQAESGNYWHGFKGHGFGFSGLGNTQEFSDRVGAVLGIDGDSVSEAMQQAQTAIKSEELEARLQAAIDSGKITEEQAAEIRDKIESGDWKGFGKRGRGHHGRHGGKGFWGRGHRDYGGGWHSPSTVTSSEESATY